MNLRLRTRSREIPWQDVCKFLAGAQRVGAEIHARMPVILPPETHERWLTGGRKGDLLPFPAEADENKSRLKPDKQTRK